MVDRTLYNNKYDGKGETKMTRKRIALVGASATGKSTVEQILCNEYNMVRGISCTTRPKREYEVDGDHYYFLTKQEITEMKEDGLLVEFTEFNNWFYCLTVAEFEDCDVIVIEPKGLKQIIDNVGRENVFVVYLTYPDELRLERSLIARGDKDTEEVKRRFEADKLDMQGMYDICDVAIVNHNSKRTAELIYKMVN